MIERKMLDEVESISGGKKRIIFMGILINIILSINIIYATDVNNFRDILIVNNKISYGIDDKGMILRSINEKWDVLRVSIPSDVKQSEWEFCGVDFVNDSIGWIIGNNKENKGIVLKTVDGGKIWVAKFPKVRDAEVSLHCISFANSNFGYIGAGEGNLLKTTDGGNSWKETHGKSVPNAPEHFSDCIKSVWVDKTNYNFVWVMMGNNDWVAMTRDGGCSWLISERPSDTEQDFIGLTRKMKNNPDWIKPVVIKIR